MSEAFSSDQEIRPHAGLFDTTHWSVVLRARDKSEVAMGSLCEAYRQPLLIWLKIRGYSPHDAEDAVQGFFAHILGRDFLQNVAKEKGAFRTFLLRCLKNHLRDLHDRNTAAKRGGGETIASLDETSDEGHKIHDPASDAAAPDSEYDKAWAQTVLANSLRQLEVECARQGHSALCAELEPVMFADETASPYQQIAVRLGMTEGAVKVAAHRIRARLKGIVRDEIMQTVANEADWQEEVRYLIQLFGR
jgi:RNA polymerase sigma-70 factor (ECF subfamily)